MGSLNQDETHPSVYVDWAVSERPFAGQKTSGDICLVQGFESGVLLGVIDGLGHGAAAARAAEISKEIIRQNACEPVSKIIELCHRRLYGTRGVVMSLVSIDVNRGVLSWAGVGNVDCRLFHSGENGQVERESPLLRAGLVGYRMASVMSSDVPVAEGDTIIFVTDGISGSFEEVIDLNETLDVIATTILEKKGKLTDDALVLVARYLGKGAASDIGG